MIHHKDCQGERPVCRTQDFQSSGSLIIHNLSGSAHARETPFAGQPHEFRASNGGVYAGVPEAIRFGTLTDSAVCWEAGARASSSHMWL